jgi:hypothetical protein
MQISNSRTGPTQLPSRASWCGREHRPGYAPASEKRKNRSHDGRNENLGRQTRKFSGISTDQQPCEPEEKFLRGTLIWSAFAREVRTKTGGLIYGTEAEDKNLRAENSKPERAHHSQGKDTNCRKDLGAI